MAGTTKSSFADVLAKLRSDEPTSVGEDLRVCLLTLAAQQHAFPGAEGGADQWERPPMPHINARTDNVIFQQIDIQQYISDDKPMLRMFGVTEVSPIFISNRYISKQEYRTDTACLHTSSDSTRTFIFLSRADFRKKTCNHFVHLSM